MTLSTKKRRYWTCKCGHRNEATRSRKCGGCGELSRPKKRVAPHARILRDRPYEWWEDLSLKIHGGERGACGYCRKPKPEDGKHERDHDHATGLPRGLACFRCNHHRLRLHTLETMEDGAAYLRRAKEFHADTGQE